MVCCICESVLLLEGVTCCLPKTVVYCPWDLNVLLLSTLGLISFLVVAAPAVTRLLFAETALLLL